MTTEFIQRVHVVIEAGNDADHLLTMTLHSGPENISARKHYRDERAIAAALRRIATRIGKGDSFESVRFERRPR